MTVDVEIGGRSRRVELERAAAGWRVSVDGRALMVDAGRIVSGWSLLIGPPEGGPYVDPGPRIGPREGGPYDGGPHDFVGSGFSRTSFEVTIDHRARGEMTVHVGGQAIDVRVIDPRAYRRRRPGVAAGQSGIRHVVAPMPGRVLKVLVSAGDRVAARQALVVVEAMKMENELRAPGDGIVREVRATAGAPVDAGAILVVLE